MRRGTQAAIGNVPYSHFTQDLKVKSFTVYFFLTPLNADELHLLDHPHTPQFLITAAACHMQSSPKIPSKKKRSQVIFLLCWAGSRKFGQPPSELVLETNHHEKFLVEEMVGRGLQL